MCSASGVEVVLRRPTLADQTPSIDDLAEWVEITYAAFPSERLWRSIGQVICVTPNAPGAPIEFQGIAPWDGFTNIYGPKTVIWLNGQTANYKLLLHELGHAAARAFAEPLAETFKNAFLNPDSALSAVERAFWRKVAEQGR